jgi:hypothetical protein
VDARVITRLLLARAPGDPRDEPGPLLAQALAAGEARLDDLDRPRGERLQRRARRRVGREQLHGLGEIASPANALELRALKALSSPARRSGGSASASSSASLGVRVSAWLRSSSTRSASCFSTGSAASRR